MAENFLFKRNYDIVSLQQTNDSMEVMLTTMKRYCITDDHTDEHTGDHTDGFET